MEPLLAPSLDLETFFEEISAPVFFRVKPLPCPAKETTALELFEFAIQNESQSTQLVLNDLFEQRNDLC